MTVQYGLIWYGICGNGLHGPYALHSGTWSPEGFRRKSSHHLWCTVFALPALLALGDYPGQCFTGTSLTSDSVSARNAGRAGHCPILVLHGNAIQRLTVNGFIHWEGP